MPEQIVESIRPSHQPLRFLFLGSLMFDRPVAELIEAMARISSDVTLTLQGKNFLGEEPSRLIEALGLEHRVHLLEPCSPEEIIDAASAYDVGVIALRGLDENERRASTSKLFTYMSAGLAVIGSDLPGIARIVKQHVNGILVEGMEASVWANAIDAFASMSPQAVDAMKQRSIEAAQLHSWERQKPAFLAEFARALRLESDGDRK
jgi:glycosyltransferase involved in cell wall biosynthesis